MQRIRISSLNKRIHILKVEIKENERGFKEEVYSLEKILWAKKEESSGRKISYQNSKEQITNSIRFVIRHNSYFINNDIRLLRVKYQNKIYKINELNEEIEDGAYMYLITEVIENGSKN